MRAQVFDLGPLRRNAEVTVRLDTTANVRLMTGGNLRAYRRRSMYRMYGGVATDRLFTISVPTQAHWFVVVDTEGLGATSCRAQVTVAG